MPHLFECWPAIARRLQSAPSVALFLDFDGTLAHIVPTPSEASLPSATRQRLYSLARHRRVRVCIISGRERATLRELIAVPRVRYLGLYGWQTGRRDKLDPSTVSCLATAKADLKQKLQGLPGVWIEDKRHTFTVHYRGAPAPSVRQAREAVRATVPPNSPLRVLPAKKAWEVLPAALTGKHDAVLRELRRLPESLPIYAGDDHADEEAFNAIPTGISIHVGTRRRSNAQFCLRDPDEVRQFLEKLEEELP